MRELVSNFSDRNNCASQFATFHVLFEKICNQAFCLDFPWEGTMRKKLIAIFAIGVFLSSLNSANAQEYAEKTEYSFDDDVVTGDLVRPDGELTVVRKRGKERSLIRVRQHFIPEMLKSVENL